MKKKLIYRSLLGMPLGIAIGHVISIITSLAEGSGAYHAVVPSLVEQFGSEIAAVVLQTALCALIGAVSVAASVIWETETWSILKQTVIYFCIISMIMLPIAYFLHWMERSMGGFLIYFIIFFVQFVIIWLIQYWMWKKEIKKINDKISENPY